MYDISCMVKVEGRGRGVVGAEVVEVAGVVVNFKGGCVGAFVEEKGVDVCRCRGKGCWSSCRVERESVWGWWLK